MSGKELFQKMLDEADGMMTAMSGVGQSEEVMDKIMQLGGVGFLGGGVGKGRARRPDGAGVGVCAGVLAARTLCGDGGADGGLHRGAAGWVVRGRETQKSGVKLNNFWVG